MLSNESSQGLLKMINNHHSKLVCVSSYVSSKNLCESRQSHIGCIYLSFLHCAFSNVSSNCLPQKGHNHIDCICSNFLHCAFSNVFSNCLPQKRHNHIGCICSTFLHCVFSHLHFKSESYCLRSFFIITVCIFSNGGL